MPKAYPLGPAVVDYQSIVGSLLSDIQSGGFRDLAKLRISYPCRYSSRTIIVATMIAIVRLLRLLVMNDSFTLDRSFAFQRSVTYFLDAGNIRPIFTFPSIAYSPRHYPCPNFPLVLN